MFRVFWTKILQWHVLNVEKTFKLLIKITKLKASAIFAVAIISIFVMHT